jgi:hypothetical protein
MSEAVDRAEELLSPADAATVLSLSADMVRLLARGGRLPVAARSTRGVRLFRRADVEELAAERAGRPVLSHAVQFYESGDFLCGEVAKYFGEGLRSGAPVVAIATSVHRDALCDRLQFDGLDVGGAVASGQLLLLDAEETLDAFMAGGLPHPTRFGTVVEAAVAHAAAGKFRQRMRAYGEMVDLLLQRGNPRAALRLEELWNALARKHRFSLLCSCRMDNFRAGGAAGQFQDICDVHRRVIPTERFHQHDTAEARLREIALLQQRASALEHCERSAEAALAMARRLVELHGATVEAVNEGEFIVRLPGSPAR